MLLLNDKGNNKIKTNVTRLLQITTSHLGRGGGGQVVPSKPTTRVPIRLTSFSDFQYEKSLGMAQ